MAAKSHVDSGVNERRLRPIYDWLDIGNNKKALQEVDKLLKKQKDFLCAKALKALALVRLGRSEEAFSAIQEVHFENPTDDPTLQAMTICYRELQKVDLIADAYERATKKDPQNEELLSHLFMSHVRNGDYKKQQQTAMALYKLKPKNPYYFWAVMSIVMQAKEADEKLAKGMLLPLAERMTEKFVKENRLEAEAEVQLYLMILEKQGKYEKAIEVMEGPLGEKISFYQDSLLKRKAELLGKLEKWPDVNEAYKKLILGNPDQWSYYLEYFKSVTSLVDSNWKPEDFGRNTAGDPIDYSYEMAMDFISALVEEQNGTKDWRRLRGPYLAQIELLKTLLQKENPLSSRIGSMVEILATFYEYFGKKPSCFVDLSHVISSLSFQDDKNLLMDKIKASLMKEVSSEITLPKSVTLPKDLNQMNRHMCYSLLYHYFGKQEDLNQQQQLLYVRELVERYHHSLIFGKELLATDFQPGDNYSLLACHSLINTWEKTGDERLISQILVLLEQCLKNSPSNFQIKLLLIKIYNVIGAVGVSYSLYESIDMKHIQLESLGYLITDALPTAAFYSKSCSILGYSIRFYTSNYKDIVDYLLTGYKFGSFTKIPELAEFREKINNSLQYDSVTIERMILDLLMETKSFQDVEKTLSSMEIDPEKDHRPAEDLVDNRDVSIYRMYNEKEKCIIDDHIVKSRTEKICWLKIRNLVVRIIAAAYYLKKSNAPVHSTENNVTNGEKHNMVDILTDLIASLKDRVASVDRKSLINSYFPIQSPGISRLNRFLQENHVETFLSLARLVISAHALVEGYAIDQSKNKHDLETADVKEHYEASLKRIQESIPKMDSISPTQIKVFLEDFSNFVETLSLGTILVSICHSILKPARNSIKKAKKKKENVPQLTQEDFDQFSNLINYMETVGGTLQDLIDEISALKGVASFGFTSLIDSENGIKNQEDVVKEVQSKIKESYRTSLFELRVLIGLKIKFLQSLKW